MVIKLYRAGLQRGQVETEETENGNGKLKRKTEAESGNGKAEIGNWSSTFGALIAPFAHARSVWGYNKKLMALSVSFNLA